MKLAFQKGGCFSGSEVADIVEYVTQDEKVILSLFRTSDLSTYQADDKEKGMTQEQLATKLNINTDSLGKIERGIKGFSIDLLIEIAVLFDASLDYIVLGRELQIDVTNHALGSIINQLIDLEKKL